MATKLIATEKEPLTGSYTDFHYKDPNKNISGVITFITISALLFDEWERIRNTDKEMDIFDIQPGVFRDDEFREKGSENCFTIILPHESPMIEQVAFNMLEQLNEKYGTDFEIDLEGDFDDLPEIKVPCHICGKEVMESDLFEPDTDEIKTLDDIREQVTIVIKDFCSEECWDSFYNSS